MMKCPLDPFVIVHELSSFINVQSLKLQECPEDLPVGELPKHIILSMENALIDQITPGKRAIITGIFSTFQSSKVLLF